VDFQNAGIADNDVLVTRFDKMKVLFPHVFQQTFKRCVVVNVPFLSANDTFTVNNLGVKHLLNPSVWHSGSSTFIGFPCRNS
jgi:hypothetical protein